jgi:hypothetical protein
MVIISLFSHWNIQQDGLNTLVNVGRHQAGLMVNFRSAFNTVRHRSRVVTADSGECSKSVTSTRNGRSRCAGIIGRDAPDYPPTGRD